MTAAAAHGGVRTFTLGLPDEWARLPLEQRAFTHAVGEHRRRWRDAGVARIDQRRLELLLDHVAGELRAADVVFAAARMDLGAAGTVELQTCTLSTHSRADLGTDLRITGALLFHAFALRGDGRSGRPEITDLEPPELCTLPAGVAVRLRRLYVPPNPTRRVQRFFGEAYVMPLGDRGTHAAMLQFATTDLGRANELSVAYRDAAGTLSFGAGPATGGG